MISRRRQAGLTATTILLVAIVVAFAATVGMRIVPMYLEYLSVATTLDSLVEEDFGRASATEIRRTISRRFSVNNVDSVDARDAKIRRVDGGLEVHLEYEVRGDLVGNLDAVASFSKTVVVPHR